MATIGPIAFTNDSTTVSYQFSYSSPTSTERQLYLDTDGKSSTGYSVSGIGADFLLANGNLYIYTGKGGIDWAWKPVRAVSYEDATTWVKWVIPRSALNWPTGIRAVAKVNKPVEVNPVITQVFQVQLPPLARDPVKWPFASNSIWNMPIGNNAVYVPARLPAVPSNDVWAPMVQIDRERISMRPEALKNNLVYNAAGWTAGADRCVLSSVVLASVPMLDSWQVPNTRDNNGAVFLLEDGRTLLQAQPLARCNTGKPGTSLAVFPPLDLYGNGIMGAHGGSYLSTLGGTLRVGELRPNPTGQGPRHALKLDLDPGEVLAPCNVMSDCFRWPARTADSGATGFYGKKNLRPIPGMKMGALLAIPASVDISKMGLETAPAKQMAWTLQNYGIYIVDSTTGAAYVIAAEEGVDGSFTAQFQKDWGFSMEQRVRDNTPWVRDMQRLLTSLNLVDNNGPTSIGGGGTLRQPKAPELPQ
jgi:hypothetical protein